MKKGAPAKPKDRGTTPKRAKSARKSNATQSTPAPAPKVSRTFCPDGMAVEEWQRQLRRQFAEKQEFRLEKLGGEPIFGDYRLTNPQTGKNYRVAVRGLEPGENYCSCPDYAINGLGTCKHIEYALLQLQRKRGAKAVFRRGFRPTFSEVYLRYGTRREVRFRAGSEAPSAVLALTAKFFDGDGLLKERRLLELPRFLDALPGEGGHEVRCYDDVLQFVAAHQDAAHRRALAAERLPDGIASPFFDTLLKATLYPYQKEGALFAATAGRSLLGDDMGLGKTIQALAASELMAELFGVRKVLIVTPTSLKYQWLSEIEQFTERSAGVIEGLVQQRREQYAEESFFKLVNYELVHRDLDAIRAWAPDLIVLDEAQRIKNWQTRTAQSVKSLESTFALVLTGTPIENRIEELHSLMEFVDRHRLGPLYRFVHAHRMLDPAGKLVGYRDLDQIRRALSGVLLRRRKKDVLTQLPGRVDKTFFVPLTTEQAQLHDEQQEIVARLVAKWRRYRFLSEADQRRLQVALLRMRMVADNTWLLDRQTRHGQKLAELETLLRELVLDGGEKVVIFSQWLGMNELVEELLTALGIGYVHLNGGVPSKRRSTLMRAFRSEPDCRVFLSTDAGGVGLNLQSGSTVINLDLPWNPAILEQRIGRVHRMGQKRGVRVINFVSRGSIEERILGLLQFKKSVSDGALDGDGEATVTLGPSQLERFMEGVDAVASGAQSTATVSEPEVGTDPAFLAAALAEETPERLDATEPAGKDVERPAAVVAVSAAPLGDLLQGAARLLAGLGEALSAPTAAGAASAEVSRGARVEIDPKSGRPCLRIDLPEPKVLRGALDGLGQLLKLLAPVESEGR